MFCGQTASECVVPFPHVVFWFCFEVLFFIRKNGAYVVFKKKVLNSYRF